MRDRPDWRDVARRHGLPELHAAHPSVMTAQLLCVRGERDAAEEACRAAIARDPGDLHAMQWLVATLQLAHRTDEAEVIARRAAMSEAAREGVAEADAATFAEWRLAVRGLRPAPLRPPRACIARQFDSGAERFDDLLVGRLSYRGPQIVRGAARAALGRRRRLRVLDAGCGTGLAAAALRPFARRLDGVDLSSRMLALAKRRGLYDDLAQGDLVDVMRARAGRYDLIAAADVFEYLGDLDEPCAAAAVALRPRGLLVFTVERAAGVDMALPATGRYVHSRRHLRRAAARAGLKVRSIGDAVLRTECRRPVRALVAVFQLGGERP